jgi:hypothetical protein
MKNLIILIFLILTPTFSAPLKPTTCKGDNFDILYYKDEIKSPKAFPILVINKDMDNQMLEVNMTSAWYNLSLWDSEYYDFEDLIWFPVPPKPVNTGVVNITARILGKEVVTNCTLEVRFWNGNDTPIVPNSLSLNTQWVHSKYRDNINGVFTDKGELTLYADSVTAGSSQTCKLDGKRNIDWNALKEQSKLSDALKYGQEFEYTFTTYVCRKESIVKKIKIGSLEFNNKITGGCKQITTDSFFSQELANMTARFDREICAWDKLYADCLVPHCGAPADNAILTVLLVIGSLILV